jgi:exodeoxyribonuclease III
MTYNIDNGGWPDRLDAVIRVIVEQRPDLLSLQELRHFERSGNGRLRRVADETGMLPFLAASRFGQPVAVFVRDGIRVNSAGSVRRPFHHGAEQVVVQTTAGPLSVLGTHLYPYSGRRRLWEARWLAARVHNGQQVLLMGDLNSLDPASDHSAELREAPPQYRKRHLRFRSSTVDTRAVAALTKVGLVDLCGSIGAAGGYTARFCQMRLDYIMATEQLARSARGCRVVTGAAAEAASDHYPLVAQFDWVSAV